MAQGYGVLGWMWREEKILTKCGENETCRCKFLWHNTN